MPSTRDDPPTCHGGAGTTQSSEGADIGEFAKVPDKMLRKLIEKGRQDAEQLDQAIRAQFQIGRGGGHPGDDRGDGSDSQ